MKCLFKCFVFFVLINNGLVGFGQTIINNGSFEDWSNGLPNSWATLAHINPVYQKLCTQDTAVKSYQTSSVKIKTDTFHFFGDTATYLVSGICFYGSITQQQTTLHYSGKPFDKRPDSIAFASKYQAVDGDTGFVGCWLTKNGAYIGGIKGVASGESIAIHHLQWDSVKLPIIYTDTATPDTLHILLRSSGSRPKTGSTLWIDNMYFFNKKTTGIANDNELQAAIYPNPTTEKLFISTENNNQKKLTIYSCSGKQVLSHTFFEQSIVLPVSHLASGLYMLFITDGQKQTVRKISIY